VGGEEERGVVADDGRLIAPGDLARVRETGRVPDPDRRLGALARGVGRAQPDRLVLEDDPVAALGKEDLEGDGAGGALGVRVVPLHDEGAVAGGPYGLVED